MVDTLQINAMHQYPRDHTQQTLPMVAPDEHGNLTTSFLTTATLVYAIGAGITAAAGTRLALQLILASVFGSTSFQLTNH